MPSEVLKKILRALKSQPSSCLGDLVAALPERLRSVENNRLLALKEVTTLVQWGLAEVRQGSKIWRLDRLQALTRFDLPDDLSVRPAQRTAEIEQAFGVSLEVDSTAVLGVPKTQPPLDLFVVMPFAREMQPVFERIQALAQGLGLSVKRGDDFFTPRPVMEDVWAALHVARMIVADCTGRNPNVFYEIGLAHAIGRHTILISRAIDDVPFDLRHLRVILYEPTSPGLDNLAANLEKAIRGLQP